MRETSSVRISSMLKLFTRSTKSPGYLVKFILTAMYVLSLLLIRKMVLHRANLVVEHMLQTRGKLNIFA